MITPEDIFCLLIVFAGPTLIREWHQNAGVWLAVFRRELLLLRPPSNPTEPNDWHGPEEDFLVCLRYLHLEMHPSRTDVIVGSVVYFIREKGGGGGAL